jgi:hypothetical protein
MSNTLSCTRGTRTWREAFFPNTSAMHREFQKDGKKPPKLSLLPSPHPVPSDVGLNGSVSPQLLPRGRGANLSLALAQDRVGCTGHGYASPFAVFLPASCVIYLAADLKSVHPHKVIRVNEPLRLEVFLANGTGRMGDRGILGDGNVSVLGLLLDGSAVSRCTVGELLGGCLIGLTIFYPVLRLLIYILCTCLRFAYLFTDIPTPMNATLGGIRVFNFEMPVHVASLLLFSLRCIFKAAPASSTLIRVCLVQSRDKMESRPRRS